MISRYIYSRTITILILIVPSFSCNPKRGTQLFSCLEDYLNWKYLILFFFGKIISSIFPGKFHYKVDQSIYFNILNVNVARVNLI